MAEPLRVLMMPESAYGPTNNLIGIGNVLRQRGHTVIFAAEASWAGKLEALGFVEDLVDLAPPADEEQDAGQFWKDFIRETAPEFRKPTIEQLGTFIRPTWQALVDGAQFCHDQLSAIVDRQHPDVIVEDNVCCFPALHRPGVPFVRVMSCNPLEMPGPDVPPVFSGYAIDDRSGWDEFRAEYERTHRDLWAGYADWVATSGGPQLPDLQFIAEGDLNLYVYPEAADYTDRRPLGPTWHRLDSSVRTTDAPFTMPDALAGGGGKLVYLSLGSLGSADVELMRRLIAILAETPHRFVVSMGPQHAELELAPNMWGAETVPQTSVLPLVDAVITHGGNNTTTECFHFGKPMVVLPLFWDQHDNAQRVHETGFGIRLATYDAEPAELRSALDRVLSDTALHARMRDVAGEVQGRAGTRLAADLIESAPIRAGA